MDPAKPPLPIPWNLPFQPEAGSQISTWISESADGFNTTATRQKSTAVLTGPAGDVKEPAGTDCAVAMVVCGSWSSARLAQVAARDGSDARHANAASASTGKRGMTVGLMMLFTMIRQSLCQHQHPAGDRFRRRILVGTVAHSAAARDEEHGRGRDPRHEQ